MAREGLLLHEEKGERPQEPEPPAPKKKWSNFWYYHKWHVVLVVVAAALCAYAVHDAFRPRPDYEVGMITSSAYPQEAVELLESGIAKYGEDLNGDGRVLVQINTYPIVPDDASQMTTASTIKLQADLSAGESMLFLTDPESFGRQQEQEQMFARTDGSTPPEGTADPAGMRLPLSEVKALSGLSYRVQTDAGGETDVFGSLGLSIRIYAGSAVEGKEDAYWQASLRLFRKLVAG